MPLLQTVLEFPRRTASVLAMLASLGAMAPACALDTQGVLALLAQTRQGQAKFTETKHLAMLERPVKSTGTLSFQAPSHLEKITLEPKPESVVLEGDNLSITRNGKTLRVNLRSHPQALAFVEAIRGVLLGDFQLLDQGYTTQLGGNEANWVLVLRPKDKQVSDAIQQINVGGQNGWVRSIELVQADGDRSVMQIEPQTVSQTTQPSIPPSDTGKP